MHSKVGIAITAHNERNLLRACLTSLRLTQGIATHIVVVDDGSHDGTQEMLAAEFPEVHLIPGTGDLWWAGGTNLAVAACLQANCDHILLLNPDVVLAPDTLPRLLDTAHHHPNAVIAPVVVDHARPDTIYWAGSQWQPAFASLPIFWTNRHLIKPGASIAVLPPKPYDSTEAHGRGVLVPAALFRAIGLYDAQHLPHYGADTDFSFRAKRAHYRILIEPQIHVRLHVHHTGMKMAEDWRHSWRVYWNYLTKRKNGEAIHVWWHITQRHLTWYSAIPTYCALLAVASLQYWARALQAQFTAKS